MLRVISILLVVVLSGVFAHAEAGPTGSKAPELPPLVREEGLKRIEIDAPGEFLEPNAHYVLTKDITAPRAALVFGKQWDKRLVNVIVDLNGHTVTYNDEAYTPDAKTVCAGISVFGTGPVVIRNGVVQQGKGRDAGCPGLNLNGTLCDVSALTIRVYGPGCVAIARAGGGRGGRIHDNYIEVHGTSIVKWSGAPAGIVLDYSGPEWEVYNNTVVGGHRSISVAANAREDHRTAAKIHHNRLDPRRTPGVKSPHAIFIYTAEGNEIYENLIDAVDARGINVQMSSKDNVVRHNLVSARYTSDARGAGGYDENRCYGYWERSGGNAGNKVIGNVFIVRNATAGDATSSSIGIIAGTGVDYPEPLMTGEYKDNVIFAWHDDAKASVSGMVFKRCGKGVSVEGNRIYARTVGVNVEGGSDGVKVHRNVMLRPRDASPDWRPLGGDDRLKCSMFENRSIQEKTDGKPPEAPTGLVALKHPGAVELRWDRITDLDVAGYRVWRDGKALSKDFRGAPFAVDLDVKPGVSYSYAVSAVDLAGNEGERSEAVTATLER